MVLFHQIIVKNFLEVNEYNNMLAGLRCHFPRIDNNGIIYKLDELFLVSKLSYYYSFNEP